MAAVSVTAAPAAAAAASSAAPSVGEDGGGQFSVRANHSAFLIMFLGATEDRGTYPTAERPYVRLFVRLSSQPSGPGPGRGPGKVSSEFAELSD